jgi:two-component system LytT family response regulator
MYKVVIVDDEPLSRRGVAARLAAHNDIIIIGECRNGQEAVETLPLLGPDILFLDVQLPGLSGVEVLRALPQCLPPAVIFLTAFSRYAIDAFEFHAVDYLLKPIDDDRFRYALSKARSELSIRSLANRDVSLPSKIAGRFAVKKRHEISFIDSVAIDWIEAVGDYSALHVGGRTHLLREPITTLLPSLDPYDFIRIHRSTVVRIDRIVHVEPLSNRDCRITLRTGKCLRVSRTFSSALWSVIRNRRAPHTTH